MKQTYSDEQQEKMLEFAKKWNITQVELRVYLDALYSLNFEKDLRFIERYLEHEQEGLR